MRECPAAGDWLQGPYVYALYQHYGYQVGDIGRLFIAGFGSSMIFGTIAGTLADKQCVFLPPNAMRRLQNTRLQFWVDKLTSITSCAYVACLSCATTVAAFHPQPRILGYQETCLTDVQWPQIGRSSVRPDLHGKLFHQAFFQLLDAYAWALVRGNCYVLALLCLRVVACIRAPSGKAPLHTSTDSSFVILRRCHSSGLHAPLCVVVQHAINAPAPMAHVLLEVPCTCDMGQLCFCHGPIHTHMPAEPSELHLTRCISHAARLR